MQTDSTWKESDFWVPMILIKAKKKEMNRSGNTLNQCVNSKSSDGSSGSIFVSDVLKVLRNENMNRRDKYQPSVRRD